MPNASLTKIPEKVDGSVATANRKPASVAEQIAREVLAERRAQVFDAQAIAEMRAEVKRRLAFKWQQAA